LEIACRERVDDLSVLLPYRRSISRRPFSGHFVLTSVLARRRSPAARQSNYHVPSGVRPMHG
jgi:hypothetical protein